MAVNVILSSTDAPGVVSRVPDGGAVDVPPGTTVRIDVPEAHGVAPGLVDPTDLDISVSDGNVTVALPDGQSVTLLGYNETVLEQAMGTGLPSSALLEPAVEWIDDAQVLGNRLSIDYSGEGTASSRVDLYFDKQDGLDVDALFAALEAELGLRDPAEHGGPNITGMNVIDQPLDLSDLLLQGSGTITVNETAAGPVIGETPAFADMASLWGTEEDTMAVNDNDVFINA